MNSTANTDRKGTSSMNNEPTNQDSPEVQATMRALGESVDAEANTLRSGEPDGATRKTAAALKQAYESAPLPAPLSELRSAIDEALNNSPQPKTEANVKAAGKPSGVYVLAVSLCIIALVISLLWQTGNGQDELADLGAAIAELDQSYSAQSAHVHWIHDDALTQDDCDAADSGSSPRCLALCVGDATGGNETTSDSVRPIWATEYVKPTGGSSQRHFPIPTIDGTSNGTSRDELRGVVVLHDNSRSMTSNDVLFDIETAYVPFPDGPVTYPAPEVWEELAVGREKFVIGDGDGLVDVDEAAIPFADPADREGRSAERFDPIFENPFKITGDHPLSTFSIDVDTASYSKTRQYLNSGRLPPTDAVRIEELVNYFPYDYLPPMGADPFTAHMEVAECPWRPEHRLARIAIKGREIKRDARPDSNLVFLLDVSGSMNQANKLPLVQRGMRMLIEQLGERDRVAIVTYAGKAGLVLPSTPGDEKAKITGAIDDLQPGGSTAGAAGIELAYKIALENFVEEGVNRVLLCTDGDFNVGTSNMGDLVRLAEKQAKENVFLSILGFGMDNLNDAMLEQVSGKANGTYAFIDTETEARKVLVDQMSGTLVTIAKDVKIQVEFNPAKVKGYRLVGYENRVLAAEDFNDDKKDAGEIGAGHTVTALYEIVPADAKAQVDAAEVDELKYQKPAALTAAADSDELLTLKLRYKQPDGNKSTLMSFPVDDNDQAFGETSEDFQFASAVASFGMLLRGSRYAGNATLEAVEEIAASSLGEDEWGYRAEFVELVQKAKAVGK